MRQDMVLILFVLTIVTVAVVHQMALFFHLYFIYPWFDVPVHFFGGVAVALGLHTRLFQKITKVPRMSLITTLSVVVCVGIVWEVFEWTIGIVDSVRYVPDTALDLVMDAIGGTVGYGMSVIMRQHDI
jgi:tetrahydromethanopterin S-methyltransferase subunit E